MSDAESHPQVSEVGLKYLTISEVCYTLFSMACFILAAVSTSNLPFVIFGGGSSSLAIGGLFVGVDAVWSVALLLVAS